MSVEIKSVKKLSVAFLKGIRSGDRLLSINSNEINDFLDYDFFEKKFSPPPPLFQKILGQK